MSRSSEAAGLPTGPESTTRGEDAETAAEAADAAEHVATEAEEAAAAIRAAEEEEAATLAAERDAIEGDPEFTGSIRGDGNWVGP